ncbi:Myb-like DNA-binding domain containing protein [Trichomonas vaginalis G3]|uniref:Myb-like DNA-binding domain containing protein n=1 Tax=Trichomonas vaginalis (strain ATCC PRA-98 / G3) TaxID=412133 RepID=A2FMB3_TRIV3|nr:homeodomain-like family [Trichomonas vaginalis G3]EAX93969.1 Myb-like DNA-binding domain containing protein [Trichomonas vaginalis G3]KAI5500941.1 homeodomain-like family [Trichomonas vaginalis G3]|eukprot:XP_001306899.1 Myb-like DNA-binding domain containing protein [Trichomonas vaginalis G3]
MTEEDSSDFTEEPAHKKHQMCIFTPEEEKILIDIHENHPEVSWREIAKKLNNKKATQCSNHYRALVKRKNGNWTEAEIDSLRQAVAQYGKNWKLISKILSNRRSIECKHVYEGLEQSTSRKDLNVNIGNQNEDDQLSSPSVSTDNLFVDLDILQLHILRTPNQFMNEDDQSYSMTFMLC